jgi:hypothetical protein
MEPSDRIGGKQNKRTVFQLNGGSACNFVTKLWAIKTDEKTEEKPYFFY